MYDRGPEKGGKTLQEGCWAKTSNRPSIAGDLIPRRAVVLSFLAVVQ